MIRQESNDRALAGVSALIVFIALVLVAAIAAAVILDTGGFLQQQAQQTGEESSDQLSSTLNVVHTVGDVTQADLSGDGDVDASVVEEVRMTVAMAPGAENLDLSSSTIEIVTENGASTLTYEADGNDGDEATPNANGAEFGILQVEADATYPLVTQPEDRYQLVIPFEDAADEEALELLEEGDNADVQIVTGPGGQTYESFRVPTALPDEETSITL